MKVSVLDRCVGHGVCEVTAGAVFEVGDDGVSHVLVEDIATTDVDAVRSAVRACPAQALALTADEPG